MLIYVFGLFFLFFFSSRRRHTRFDCDWSSDVCSSDLAGFKKSSGISFQLSICTRGGAGLAFVLPVLSLLPGIFTPILRSEERRVGKSVDLGGRRIIKKKKKKHLKIINMIQ